MPAPKDNTGSADSLEIRILRDPCPKCPKKRFPPFDTYFARGDTLRLPDKTHEHITNILISTDAAFVYTATDRVIPQEELESCVRICKRCGREVV